MAENNGLKLFGFEIRRSNKTVGKELLPSIVPPTDEDGAGYVTSAGAHYGTYVNIGDEDKKSKDDLKNL